MSITNVIAQNSSYNQNTAPISGTDNSGFGFGALNNSTTGSENTATGGNALNNNVGGTYNTANGYQVLYDNKNGDSNTGVGNSALYSNTNGSYNTANGVNALFSNDTGYKNIAIGVEALYYNTSGYYNTASGYRSLYKTTTGNNNTGTGLDALYNNTIGDHNTATGMNSLGNNTVGYYNTATGGNALTVNTTGYYNTALGSLSDVVSSNLHNATAIGNGAIVQGNDLIQLGDANVTQIQCWSGSYGSTSDGRFKTNIKENDVKGLDFITRLRPVVYNMDTKKLTEFMTKNFPDSIRNKHLAKDFTKSAAIRQSGFIAQEVEKAAKEVGYDFNGVRVPENDNQAYSLAYGQFVVPLVKAVQEQQQMIEALKQQVENLKNSQATTDPNKNGTTTGINQLSIPADGFSMDQNIPNPFNGETVVKYNLPGSINNAYMAVYDLSGKQITTFPINQKGSSSITLTSEKLAAGIYIYSIVADGKIMDSKRMVVAEK